MDRNLIAPLFAMALASTTGSALASTDEAEDRSELRRRVGIVVGAYKNVIAREEEPVGQASAIHMLKRAPSRESPKIDTKALTVKAVELYKREEIRLSKILNPAITPLDYFNDLTGDAYVNHFMGYLDTRVSETEILGAMRSIVQIYGRIGDLYRMDGEISEADRYYMLASNLVVFGSEDYSDKDNLAFTLHYLGRLLKKTSTYKDAKKPVLSWALDTFKARDTGLSDKIFDMVFCGDVEVVKPGDLLAASYYSYLRGTPEYAKCYLASALARMSDEDPMFDANTYNLSDRLANRLATDVLSALLFEDGVSRLLMYKWTNLLSDEELYWLSDVDTVFGVINEGCLGSAKGIYTKIRALHHVNVGKFSALK